MGDEYLGELGRAVYIIARVAGVCTDILRVWGRDDTFELAAKEMGRLRQRLETFAQQDHAPSGLSTLIDQLGRAIETRNALIHALPTAHGLLRYVHGQPGKRDEYREFYTVDSLKEVTA